MLISFCCFFFFQAEDGIRDLVRSRGLGDVYKRQDVGEGNLLVAAAVQDELLHALAELRERPLEVEALSLIHI